MFLICYLTACKAIKQQVKNISYLQPIFQRVAENERESERKWVWGDIGAKNVLNKVLFRNSCLVDSELFPTHFPNIETTFFLLEQNISRPVDGT